MRWYIKATSSIKRRAAEVYCVDRALVAHEIQPAFGVLAEGGDALGGGGDLPHFLQDAVLLGQGEDALGFVVAEDVGAVEGGVFVAAVDVAAGDGGAVLPGVGEDGRRERLALAAVLVGERRE